MYVTMIDTFMSGWGPAQGKDNLFAVECDDGQQVEQILKAAAERAEMRKLMVVHNEPKSNGQRVVTLTHYNNLGGSWRE
jgi:hypothetical protein